MQQQHLFASLLQYSKSVKSMIIYSDSLIKVQL